MAGKVLLDFSGKRILRSQGTHTAAVTLGASGDPCCCDESTRCVADFTAVWGCNTETWAGPFLTPIGTGCGETPVNPFCGGADSGWVAVHMGPVCDPDGVNKCRWHRVYPQTGTCAVDEDCTSTANVPSLPANGGCGKCGDNCCQAADCSTCCDEYTIIVNSVNANIAGTYIIGGGQGTCRWGFVGNNGSGSLVQIAVGGNVALDAPCGFFGFGYRVWYIEIHANDGCDYRFFIEADCITRCLSEGTVPVDNISSPCGAWPGDDISACPCDLAASITLVKNC